MRIEPAGSAPANSEVRIAIAWGNLNVATYGPPTFSATDGLLDVLGVVRAFPFFPIGFERKLLQQIGIAFEQTQCTDHSGDIAHYFELRIQFDRIFRVLEGLYDVVVLQL